MGTLFRSRHMQLAQLFIQLEAAHDTIDELGKLGLIQFRDLNPNVNSFNRNFVNEVKRADEMERKLRYFEEQLKKHNMYEPLRVPPHVRYEMHVQAAAELEEGDNVVMEDLEVQFEELERELIQLSANQQTLDRNANELTEMRFVLEKDDAFFGNGGAAPADEFGMNAPLMGGMDNEVGGNNDAVAGSSFSLGFVTGVILEEKVATFERVLWRAMRGNLFMKREEIDDYIRDPSTNELESKCVFILFYQGRRSEAKIKKLCDAFGASLYPCPESPVERTELRNQVKQRLDDLGQVLSRTNEHMNRLLTRIADQLEYWKLLVLKEKSIYHCLNMFLYDVGRRCLIAEGWVPQDPRDVERIREALRRGTNRSGAHVPSILSIVETKDSPPTYFVTNRFTKAFQLIIDSYGVGRYREVSPTPLTIVTFPFLFGVMFGDIGHGTMMLLMSIWFIYKERQFGRIKLPEMIDTVFDGRYVILLMSIFAVYCGSLYNECFSVPIQIFPTNWQYSTYYDESLQDDVPYPNQYASQIYPGYTYPYGVDPLWKGAENELLYYNSVKMKMSVLLGVVQMVCGVILSLLNAIHFKLWYNILFEFIPQMIFILSLFGYMDFLIIYKWLTNYNAPKYINAHFMAPRLLNLLIQWFLSPWRLGTKTDPTAYDIYPGQMWVQIFLLIIALIAVPWMLFPKPLLLRYDHNKKMRAKQENNEMYALVGNDDDEVQGDDDESSSDAGLHSGHHDEEEFDFGEIFTHQSIHTIEYVLGCISNTASYLRLWALSLAHAELSEVFWQRVLQLTFNFNFLVLFCSWSVWAFLTIAVLLVMESLSAFLHALRLHWVEFQNKFYLADGYAFVPFSYEQVIADEEEAALMQPSS